MPEPEDTQGRGPVVVVVDDDPDIREALQNVFEEEGFTVTTAGDGQTALDSLRAMSRPPCAVVLDLLMPVMDGKQFVAELRRSPHTAALPVIVITGVGGGGWATIPGAFRVLKKPFDNSELIAAVRACCT
jgi:two-component system chemotaxis response regulator CheY